MKIAVVTTGDEIMSGNVVDTNSAWIADKCWMLGHEVVWHGGVGDFADAIGDACLLAERRAEAVFVTGGLGATLDDITVESAAKAFGKKMVLHDDIWRGVQDFFKRGGRECTENNKRQAYLPEGGKPLTNTVGTAPGVQVKFGRAVFFFVPGVPKELYQIFNDSILPWLKGRSPEGAYEQRFLKCYGIPEASFDERLKGIELGEVRMSFRVTFPEVKIKLIVRKNTAQGFSPANIGRPEGLRCISNVEKQVRERIGEYIFGVDDDTMASVVGGLLLKKKMRLAVAESCTGGLISNILTNVPGASSWFERGVVSYSNESKMQFLGVKEATLKKHGAVSEAAAREMAEGIRKISGADMGLSVTGIAGPTGGTKEKPVGTVHIALATSAGTGHVERRFPRDRESFKLITAYEAMDLVRRELLQY
jgi:nicotinamide-nucleotide amidase